jgi:hypothetical protein
MLRGELHPSSASAEVSAQYIHKRVVGWSAGKPSSARISLKPRTLSVMEGRSSSETNI